MDLVIATHNSGKLKEFKDILKDKFDNIISLDSLKLHCNVDENGLTFLDNALIKAQYIKDMTDFAVLADDTGLCVFALGGQPGVRSARFAGDSCSDADNRKKLLDLLDGTDDRRAYFETALVLLLQGGQKITATGRVHGHITQKEQGERGFGYDSVFWCDNLQKTFAEASLEEKDKVSHRYNAIMDLLTKL